MAKNTEDQTTIDIWDLLERSGASNKPQAVETKAKAPEEIEKDKKTWRRKRRLLDVMSVLLWTYAVFVLFGFDPIIWALQNLSPNNLWLANYRFVIVFIIAPTVAAFFWKWETLLGVVYILFFPLICTFWKIPRFFYNRKSWILTFSGVNVLLMLLRNLKYNLLSKSLGVLCVLIILAAQQPVLVGSAAVGLFIVFAWGVLTTLRRSTEQNWFLENQKRAIDKITKAKFVKNMTQMNEVLEQKELKELDATQATSISTAISASIFINKGLYFWAYQLQRYRKARLSIFFNCAGYAWLLLGSMLTFGLLNLALWKIDPSQYAFVYSQSKIIIFSYGASTLLLNEGSGVVPVGGVANILKLVAAFYGLVFLLAFFASSYFTWRNDRDDRALKETIEHLRKRALEQDEDLKRQVNVGADEALKRLQTLGKGFASWLIYISAAIPKDFLDPEK
jgi:hypothetical protein